MTETDSKAWTFGALPSYRRGVPVGERQSSTLKTANTGSRSSRRPAKNDRATWLMAIAWMCAAGAVGCQAKAAKNIEAMKPVYNTQTGRLQQISYDADRNGRPDTRAYMDGTRVLRIEIDADENGVVDRWEYYDGKQRLERVGYSRAADGKADAWGYPSASGELERLEMSTSRDGRVNRREYYEAGTLTRAEEDTNGDDRIDRWEAYAQGVLASVSLATARTVPDRRFVYRPDGGLDRLEVDPDGDGRFEIQGAVQAGARAQK